MPFYEVYHSCVLTQEQKQALATSITDLHCTKFTTPSFFVHIRFIEQDIHEGNYFMAGKPRATNSNRILGIVRTSATRPISAFDVLADQIEDAWYKAVGITAPASSDPWGREDEAKRLLLVTFIPMVTVREAGMAIPQAGQEGSWLNQQVPFMKEMSQKGLTDFTEMLDELEQRDDLKKAMKDC